MFHSLTPYSKSKGFTFIELIIGVVIVTMVLSIISDLANNFIHKNKINNSAKDFASILVAVESRSAHDGFLFSLWDTNGNNTALGNTLFWDKVNIKSFYTDYLVGRKNVSCGNLITGWNPLNIGGNKNTGEETSMERAALLSCTSLRGVLPWNITLSSALSKDTTDSVSKFAVYLNMDKSYFDLKNSKNNNILNYMMLKESLKLRVYDGYLNGKPSVEFGLRNDLTDINDDIIYTDSQCENALINKNKCDIILYVDFAGTTNGLFKRTDNQNFFTDDTTWGKSLAAGRQKCAYWNKDIVTNVWTSSLVDCGIIGGSNRNEVSIIMDNSNSSSFLVTNKATLSHTCKLFKEKNIANNNMLMTQKLPPNNVSPCGVLQDGSIVQLISDEAHIGKVFGEKILAKELFASQTTLFSDINGQKVLRVFDSTHNITTFTIDSNGNTTTKGSLDVAGVTTLADNLFAESDVFVSNNATFYMDSNSIITMGDQVNGLTFSRNKKNGQDNFTIESSSIHFELLNKNKTGLSVSNINGADEINLNATGGVIAKNGTTIHNSKSSLTGADFNVLGNINSNALKSLSETVSYDMVRYLDDTSSPIQLVGIDRIEGVFTTLTKPDCLAFTKDSNYTSPEANPYKDILPSLPQGESLARLLLTPTYFKTYNAAFGNNQLYAQHAIHSSPTTWDIFLYLSGEGALGTGAREDGAGASLAQTYCDYQSINFSRKIL